MISIFLAWIQSWIDYPRKTFVIKIVNINTSTFTSDLFRSIDVRWNAIAKFELKNIIFQIRNSIYSPTLLFFVQRNPLFAISSQPHVPETKFSNFYYFKFFQMRRFLYSKYLCSIASSFLLHYTIPFIISVEKNDFHWNSLNFFNISTSLFEEKICII